MKTDLLFRRYSKEEALMLSPLQLAYVGDSVHALLIRTFLTEQNLPVRKMHLLSTAAVNAVSQNQALCKMLPLLSEEEILLVKRGRNAHPHHGAPKSASVGEYAGATGLETLLGFWYLTGNLDRITQMASYLCPQED